jgi:hypothetical protein
MAIIIFWQNIGASTSLIAANAIFSNSLRQQLQQRKVLIGYSPDVIVAAGVRSIRLLKYLSKLLTRCRVWAEAQWNMFSQMQNEEANPDTNRRNHQIPNLDQTVRMKSMDLGDD